MVDELFAGEVASKAKIKAQNIAGIFKFYNVQPWNPSQVGRKFV